MRLLFIITILMLGFHEYLPNFLNIKKTGSKPVFF